MAAKPEETTTAPTEGAGLFSGPSQEKQPEANTTAAPADKKDDVEAVDSATAGVADLSVAEKKGEDEKKEETKEEEKKEEPKADEPKVEEATTAAATEEKKVEEASPADTTTPAVAAPPADAPSDAQPEPATAAATTTTTTEPTTTEPATTEPATTEPATTEPATTEPAAATTEGTNGPVWPETALDHPLTKFFDCFEALVTEAQHSEVYGIELSKSNAFHTKLILQKFLRANQNDLEKAKAQLLETLKWRKTFDPVKAASDTYEKTKFDGLGYVLELESVPGSLNKKDIATFNIYGSVKDNKATFGDLDGFLRWRVGLMEKSIQALSLSSATAPIPNYGEGPDPYQGFQVHDYLQVSFIRRDPLVKAATNKTIEILGRHYPETLSRKFFVNVPTVMGWLFNAIKLVVAKETSRKFVVLSNGSQLANELGKGVPKSYGGEKPELAECAETMAMA